MPKAVREKLRAYRENRVHSGGRLHSHIAASNTFQPVPAESQVRITEKAAIIMGLDDVARYPDIKRRAAGRYLLCIGTVDGLTNLVTELSDRATEGTGGYDTPSRAKRVCAQNVARVIRETHGEIKPLTKAEKAR
jgi:hypothetical protein